MLRALQGILLVLLLLVGLAVLLWVAGFPALGDAVFSVPRWFAEHLLFPVFGFLESLLR